MTDVLIKVIAVVIFLYSISLLTYWVLHYLKKNNAKDRIRVLDKFWKEYKDLFMELDKNVLHWNIQEKQLIRILQISILIGILSWVVFNSFLLFLIIILTLYYSPKFLLNQYYKKRTAKIDVQLVDALVLMANSLKAGLDIIQGMELIVRDLHAPIKEEFEIVLKEYNLGTPFEETLINLRQRVKSKTVNTFVTSIIIQRASGGDVTKIIDEIINTIRETYKIENKTKTLTSQGRMQAKIIIALPWVMALTLLIIQPDFMIPMFTSTLGVILLSVVVVWQIIGAIVINKIVNIEI
jgi:tight adherence protein B